jgi:hypothetical protein
MRRFFLDRMEENVRMPPLATDRTLFQGQRLQPSSSATRIPVGECSCEQAFLKSIPAADMPSGGIAALAISQLRCRSMKTCDDCFHSVSAWLNLTLGRRNRPPGRLALRRAAACCYRNSSRRKPLMRYHSGSCSVSRRMGLCRLSCCKCRVHRSRTASTELGISSVLNTSSGR